MNTAEFAQQAQGAIHIYTDGACLRNPGPGGWGAYMVDEAGTTLEISGGDPDTTNNRMEMMAVIEALEGLPDRCRVVLFTDSMYLKKGITEWIIKWRKTNWMAAYSKEPVKNQDLWIRIDALNQRLAIEWRWVPGHAGVFGNERADALAKNAIMREKIRKS